MKKQTFFAFAIAGAIIAFCGCAELQLDPSGAKRLNQTELELLFQTEIAAEFLTSGTRVSVTYFPDRRQECDWGSGNDKGTYRINNGEFCSTWTWLRNGSESCSKIYKIGENEFEFRSIDGISHAIMRLK
jgi:hypothetical protein